jgi:YfiH family protein
MMVRMLNKLNLIIPDWPAPSNVHAIQTTRQGGFSDAPFESLNLGAHVQDQLITVVKNRQLLDQFVPAEPVWLNQVHGTNVVDAALSSCVQDADASFTTQSNVVCVTMTADCLPVLLCNKQGTAVAAIHAGWRSLCDGVIENAVLAMGLKAEELLAWLGPAIGPDAFEVGAEVRQAFIEKDNHATQAFQPHADKWLANLYLLATQRLNNVGIKAIYGGGDCTYSSPERYFSFRRDGMTGRMATMIWLAKPSSD